MSLGLLLIRFLVLTLNFSLSSSLFENSEKKKKGKIIACCIYILPLLLLLLLLAVSKVESSGGFSTGRGHFASRGRGSCIYPGPIYGPVGIHNRLSSGSALSGQCLTPLRGPVSSSQPPTKPDSHDVQCYPPKNTISLTSLFSSSSSISFFFLFLFGFLFFSSPLFLVFPLVSSLGRKLSSA